MKHILALLTLLSVFVFAVPSAQADCGRRVVSYTACGRPIYAHYEKYGYDRCGNPVGRWVTDWYRCSCDICNPRPVYQSPRYYDYDDHYSRSHSGCDDHHHSGRFYFSFGR